MYTDVFVLFLYRLISMAPFIWWDRYLFDRSLFWWACHLYRLIGLRTFFVSKASFFGQTIIYWTVIFVVPLVLGPGPYDDSFIYWTVSFLALALRDRHFLSFSLDALTSLLVRQFLRPCPYDDSFIYWTVSFLALALTDRHFLGLSLDVFDIFVGPSVFRTLSIWW